MNHTTSSIESRPPNWLPLPGVASAKVSDAPVVDEDDLFPKGEIATFYPHQGRGSVSNSRGDIFEFKLSEIHLLGPKGDPKYLVPGGRIGYDVSCTSHGRRISRMKVY